MNLAKTEQFEKRNDAQILKDIWNYVVGIYDELDGVGSSVC